MSIITRIKGWWKSLTPDEKVGTVIFGIGGTAVTVCGAVCLHETREARKLIKMAIGDIGNQVDVTVSDSFVQSAVEEAAKKQITKSVNNAINMNWRDIQDETRKEVRSEVQKNYERITDEVSSRLAKECEEINSHKLAKDITEKAKEALSAKFDSKLDNIAEEYTKNLNNMGKVYEALADKLQNKA